MKKMILKAVLASVLTTTVLSSAWAGGVLHRSSGATPETLDPQKTSTQWEGFITREMFEGLVSQTNDNKIIGALAESWTISENGKTYTFKLRDAKWSDGKQITADDVVYSYQRLFDPKTAAGNTDSMSIINNAKDVQAGKKPVTELGVKALDNKTVEIKLDVARSFFLNILVGNTAYIVPKHAIEKYGVKWTRPENVVVNSAFVLKERLAKASITLDKNPNYWNAKNVDLDGVKYHILENHGTAVLRYRAGDIHTTEGIPSGQYSKLKKEFGDELVVGPSSGLYYYSFNNNRFTDQRVRKALSLAVNRDIIVNKILANGVKVSHKIVAPGVSNYSHKPELKYKSLPQTERLALAKRLLNEAGYSKDKPLDIEIRYNNSDAHKKVAVAVGGMWKELGVNVTFSNAEAKVHYAKLGVGEYDVARAGFGGTNYDAATILRLFRTDNRFNYGKFSAIEFDKYYDAAYKEVNAEKRAALLEKAEQIALDNHAVIPIYHYVVPHLVSTKVKGYSVDTFATQRSAGLSLDK